MNVVDIWFFYFLIDVIRELIFIYGRLKVGELDCGFYWRGKIMVFWIVLC